jgi:hypothetical protein
VVEGWLDVIKHTGMYPDPAVLELAYEKTVPGSPLRCTLVEVYVKDCVGGYECAAAAFSERCFQGNGETVWGGGLGFGRREEDGC